MYYIFAFGFPIATYIYVLLLFKYTDSEYIPLVKYFMFLLVGVFALLASFRLIGYDAGVAFGGIDAHAYKDIYSAVSNQHISETFQYQPWEYGFSLLFWTASNMSIPYELLQFAIYLFMLYTVVEVARRTYSGPAALLCLIALTIAIIDSFNLLRTYLALFLGVWSLFKFVDSKYKTSMLLVAVALTLHVSALVFVMMFFFSLLYRLNIKVYYAALFFGIFLSTLFSQLFLNLFLSGTRVSYYLTSDEQYFAIGTYLAVMAIWFSLRFARDRLGNDSNLMNIVHPMLPSILIVLPVHIVHYMAYRMLFPYIILVYFLVPIGLKYLGPFKTGFKALPTVAFAVVLFYPLFKVYGFLVMDYNGELSAQEYRFDWAAFGALFP